jgi:hypothetical protein
MEDSWEPCGSSRDTADHHDFTFSLCGVDKNCGPNPASENSRKTASHACRIAEPGSRLSKASIGLITPGSSCGRGCWYRACQGLALRQPKQLLEFRKDTRFSWDTKAVEHKGRESGSGLVSGVIPETDPGTRTRASVYLEVTPGPWWGTGR